MNPHVASLLPPEGAVSAFGRPGATDMNPDCHCPEPTHAPTWRVWITVAAALLCALYLVQADPQSLAAQMAMLQVR